MSKRIFIISLIFSMSIMFGGYTDWAQSEEIQLIKPGDLFPQTPLQMPSDPQERNYLGLPEGKSFMLNDIKAELILVEIISVYCPSCQRQVPAYNKLFGLIESDPKTKGHVKIIGIAAGNGGLEVKDFIEKYKVRFPIVPDPRFEMHQAIGGSRTPFTIYVRQDPSGPAGVVLDTHLGLNRKYKQLFAELRTMMSMDLAAIRKESKWKEAETIVVKPVLTKRELQTRVKGLFATLDGRVSQFEKIDLKSGVGLYTALVEEKGISNRYFAKVTSRPPTCDLCHDIHFIYVFDSAGKVVRFEPIQLTKYGNKRWNETDVVKMRERIIGRYISGPFIFDPKLDAVSSATITSAVIINAIFQGETLLEELREKGLI